MIARLNATDNFSEFELFQMFNIELEAGTDAGECAIPLWKNTKRTKNVRRFKTTRIDADHVRGEVTVHEPGTKGRVADLAAFYADHEVAEKSAFDI